jgi:hypothetical protein
MREGFDFTSSLPDDTPVRVEAGFDHEDTVYVRHVWELLPDGTVGRDFADVLSVQAGAVLLEQAASRIPGEGGW